LVYPTLNATQLALITPTFTASPTETQTLAPTETASPTLTPTPNATNTATTVPSITPTATPYTLKGYQDQYQKALKSYAALGLTDSEFRFIFFESTIYYDRVKAKVTGNITHEQEQIWARHILVADLATAQAISAQLATGADFGTLAAKLSIDTGSKDKGGDLGWFGRGKMVAEFENAAFSMKVGEISQPIKSTYGYHIIQVLGHESRPLTEQEYTDAVSAAFAAWLQTERASAKVVINNGWANFVPTSPTLAQAQANEAATATAYLLNFQATNAKK
jgi:peptidyl-prolyl cis-trans isomerase D